MATSGTAEEKPGTEAGVRAEVFADPIEQAAAAGASGASSIAPVVVAVDVERDRRVKRLRNQGLFAYLPGRRFPGHKVRLRPQQHGALSMRRAEWRKEIEQLCGVKKGGEMPPQGQIEMNRRLVLYTVVEWHGVFIIDGENRDTSRMSPGEIRRFLEQYYFPPIDLTAQEPDFEEFDMDLLNILLETHDRLDGVPHEVLDEKKGGFVLGAPSDIDYSG